MSISEKKPTLIVIAGPTASGKTALSIAIAKAYKAEIIGADSRQLYTGMDIGTAKPSHTERQEVPHHFVDFLPPDSLYSVGDYEREVLQFLEGYFQQHKVAVMAGGSGLFLKAIMEGLDDLPPTPPEVRQRWQTAFQTQGVEFLQTEIKRQDPEFAAEVDLANPIRLQRALEAMEVSGKKFSELRKGEKKIRPFQTVALTLMPDREELYTRINARVDQMMEAGLLEEVERLLPLRSLNALNAVGYKELFEYMDGTCSLEEAVEKIKQHTRNFAKRQFTWFRKQSGFETITDQSNDEILRHLQKGVRVS